MDEGLVIAESWVGRRVLVTGHTGFKGSWLCLLLHRLGAEVSGFSLDVPTEPSHFVQAGIAELVDDHRGDVTDPAAVATAMARARPEVVVHLAAQPLVRASYDDPVGTYATNVMGTVHVLEAVRHVADVRAVVVATTDKCYENREWLHPYREPDRLGGRDPYSSSKAAAELVAAAYRASFLDRPGSPRLATVRAGNVVGPGDHAPDRLVPDAVRAALAGDTLRVRHPAATRPWQDVLDCLHGYLLVAEQLLAGTADEPWNLAPDPDGTWTVAAVLEQLAVALPMGLTWETDPTPGPHEAGLLALDATKARTTLGWRPLFSLEESLRRLAEWHVAVAGGADARAASLGHLEELLVRSRKAP